MLKNIIIEVEYSIVQIYLFDAINNVNLQLNVS